VEAWPRAESTHENGGIVCLWHEQKVAIVVDPDDQPPVLH
jgi:hypothetical protein